MENAYKEYLEINGKQVGIPEVLTFSQILNCEMKGLNLEEIQEGKAPLQAMTIVYSVIAKKSIEDATKDLDLAFANGLKLDQTIEIILKPFVNFFVQTSNQEVKEENK